jgi:hypothetical protein
MTIPTLSIPSATPRSASQPSYDTWQYDKVNKISCNTRFIGPSSGFVEESSVPYIIVPKSFPKNRIMPSFSLKFMVIGRNGFLPDIAYGIDEQAPVVIENDGHCTLAIRTNSNSIGAFSVSDPDRSWSGQLQYDNKSDQWVFCTNHLPQAYLSNTGAFSIGRNLNTNPASSNCKLHVSRGITPEGLSTTWGSALAVFEDNDQMFIKLRTNDTGTCGIRFSSRFSDYTSFIQYNHSSKEFSIGNVISNYKIGFDKLGSVIISSVPYPFSPMVLAGSLFYLYGNNANPASGPHWKAHTSADIYPLLQNLNWSHDNIAFSFDCFFESPNWKSSHASGSFQIYKQMGRLCITCAQAAANTLIPVFTNAVLVENDGRVIFQCSNTPASSAMVELLSTVGALLLSRMSTAERNALTAVNGMILYNTDLGKVQVYESGAWASVV